ncbi:DUF1992 domain-containing protein [Ilumatobacter sp.]|uniref:DnaJ family domain-containing protein n=1 Tax=Ilumatobacter sp. TaxID=1967498 RepID=UPI003C693B74
MTERKPPDVSWESWIERQIQNGQHTGAFDDLPGTGRPIDDLDQPHDELWWVKAKLQRDDVVYTPPTIAIRTDRDATVAAALVAPTEADVRALILALNERIAAVNRRASPGPPSTVAKLDVERIVDRWRVARSSDDLAVVDPEGSVQSAVPPHFETIGPHPGTEMGSVLVAGLAARRIGGDRLRFWFRLALLAGLCVVGLLVVR